MYNNYIIYKIVDKQIHSNIHMDMKIKDPIINKNFWWPRGEQSNVRIQTLG